MTSGTPIKLMVGLGNPGPEYAATRHNAGFWLAERYAESAGATLRVERGYFAKVAKAGTVWVMLPQTFMNRSGQAVAALANFYKISPDAILVAHDELDLLPGAAKFKKGGGHAGHNGLKSIAAALGTSEFWRLRIGIGHPRSLAQDAEVVDFVLHAPRREEAAAIDDAIARCLSALPPLLAGDAEVAMMRLHTPPA